MKMTGIWKKIRDTAGETIAETLIALLVAALSLTMLATMISSTVNMVTTSKEKIKEYYGGNNLLELQKEETRADNDTQAPSAPSSVTVTLSATGADNMSLKQEISADLFSNETFQNKTIYAYSLHKETD